VEVGMTVATLTVTEVNQNFSRARKAVAAGPVIITDHGTPAMVLMTYADFKAQGASSISIVDRLDCPGTEDIAFDPPRLGTGVFRPADLG
jgi:prevent-host-death family protein